MFADFLAALDALLGPGEGHFQASVEQADAGGGEGEAAGVEGGEGDFEAFSGLADDVPDGDFHIGEADDSVVESFEAHEVAAGDDLDSGLVHFYDECRSCVRFLGCGGACHDDEAEGFEGVGTPELFSVEYVVAAVFGKDGLGGHAGGVGADFFFGEGEGGDSSGGAACEVLFLLRLGAEDEQWLGQADGLVGGKQGGQVPAVAAEDHGGAGVIGLGEAEAAVFFRNLDAEGAHLGEAFEDAVGNLPFPVDGVGIGLVIEEGAELFQEDIAFAFVLRWLDRERGKWWKNPCAIEDGGGEAGELAGIAEDSASSKAARCPSDIFEVSMMDSDMGLAELTYQSN